MASKKHKLHKMMADHSARADTRRKQQFFSNGAAHTGNSHATATDTHRTDDSGIALPNEFGHRSQAHQPNENRIGFNSSSVMRRNKRIKMSNYHIEHCNQDFWSGTINSINSNELLVRKWSFDVNIGSKNKTVNFR